MRLALRFGPSVGLALLLAACSGGGNDGSTGEGSADTLGDSSGDASDVDQDTTDTRPDTTDTGGDGSDGGDDGGDGSDGSGDTDGRPTGEPCVDDEECESGICYQVSLSPVQGICTSPCARDRDCLEGYDCIRVDLSADATSICVPSEVCLDGDGDGYGLGPACLGTDCDDASPTVNQGAAEVCDGLDNDCDRQVDDNPIGVSEDCDTGFLGVCAAGRLVCDGSLTCEPRATATAEACDGLDNDCDGEVDEEASDAVDRYRDADGDGFGDSSQNVRGCGDLEGYVRVGGDCDDSNRAISPGAVEQCDAIDNDCDGVADDDIVYRTFYADLDADGYGSAASGEVSDCTARTGYSATNDDCVDSDPSINPGARETAGDEIDQNCDRQELCILDADDDQYVASLLDSVLSADTDCDDPGEARLDADLGDCDDRVATTFPGAEERCNGRDDDCDGVTDEDASVDALIWYRDVDADGFGRAATFRPACAQPAGFVALSTDCDDTLASVSPAGTEVCDGVDNNCSGMVDEPSAVDARDWYQDLDGDGDGSNSNRVRSCRPDAGYVATSGDCDDADAFVYSGADELCDGIDNDCNVIVDDDYALDAPVWYRDADADERGNIASFRRTCNTPFGYIADSSDCDDTRASVYPGATEFCNGIDDDCDAQVDEGSSLDAATWYRDRDNDGFGVTTDTRASCVRPAGFAGAGGDCDDLRSDVRPGAIEEAGDGLDQNCDGQERCFADRDDDLYRTDELITSLDTDCDDAGEGTVADLSGDCDDLNAVVNPGRTETIGNGLDEDCDGIEQCFNDRDGDGYRTNERLASADADCDDPEEAYATDPSPDCDDFDEDTYPGAFEVIADGADQNCDGKERCYRDVDDDGYRVTDTVLSEDADCFDSGEALASEPAGDCYDTLAYAFPGATETVGDGVDANCDSLEFCFADSDRDGFRADSIVLSFDLDCADSGEALVSAGIDCNDNDSSIKPSATETIGDGIDRNCDGVESCYANRDGDGYRSSNTSDVIVTDVIDCTGSGQALSSLPGGDCADEDATIYPTARELPGDSIDQDCSGNEDCYRDRDNDGYRTDEVFTSSNTSCGDAGEAFESDPAGDCNDFSSAVFPGAVEAIADGVDQDCSGGETCFKDSDDDGYRPDATSTVASTDADCADRGEGVASDPTTDCDDNNAARNPGRTDSLFDNVDSNCDSFDGTVSKSVFVSTTGCSDAFDGATKESPKCTIAAALGVATPTGRNQLIVAQGTYSTLNGYSFSNGINVAGGFSGTNWAWSSTAETTLESTDATRDPVVTISGSSITSATDWEYLTIRSPSATTAGASSYAVHCVNCGGLTITGCTISAGDGAAGTSGTNGTNGASRGVNVGAGSRGGNGNCDGGGGNGGAGGPGCNRGGDGSGGGGGSSSAGSAGAVAGVTGGSGGAGVSAGACGKNDGRDGGPGAAGDPGSNGAAGSGYSIVSNFWVPRSGSTGGDGQDGGGGGGGSGSSGQRGNTIFPQCLGGGGNGGGGGGGGGCAGLRGTGGGGGGGSFGVFLVDSTGAQLTSSTVSAGRGGSGGNGGSGGSGQSGAGGGDLRADCEGEIGRSGRGGSGGSGGRGGAGGGGQGGNSYAIWRQNSVIGTAGNTLTAGTAGAGGASAGNAGSAGAAGTIF